MTINDLPRDEIRRELRDIDRANDAAMPKWRSALSRLIGGDECTTDEKAAILGVPSPTRRNLFKIGGASVLGAAVLASGGFSVAAAGRRPSSAPPGSDASGGMGPEMDLVLAKTAASLEKLAVDTYTAGAGLLTVQAVIDAATMFSDHHQQHLDALNGVITGAGAEAVTEANAAVFEALIKPAVDAAVALAETDPAGAETAVVTLAVTLEEAAAQTYCFAAGALSAPALRSTIMTIGGVEARHAAVLRVAAFAQPATEVFVGGRSFFPGENPLAGIDGALITS